MVKKVIGIDPGLEFTGIGIVKGVRMNVHAFSYGVVKTSKSDSLSKRLNDIFDALCTLLEREKPDVMVIENAFSLSKYPKSGISLGNVMGVVHLAGYKFGLIVQEVSVREAKKILTGNGKADKVQLEKGVRHFLKAKDPIHPSHASDALALAVIGLLRMDKGFPSGAE